MLYLRRRLGQAVYYVLSTRRPFVDTAEPSRNTTTLNRLIRHHTRRLRKLGCWLEPLSNLRPTAYKTKSL